RSRNPLSLGVLLGHGPGRFRNGRPHRHRHEPRPLLRLGPVGRRRRGFAWLRGWPCSPGTLAATSRPTPASAAASPAVSWRSCLFLVAALAFWVVVVIPCRQFWGDTSAVYCTVALAICLLPALLTLAWSVWARGGPPEQQLVAVLGGTGLRLVVV